MLLADHVYQDTSGKHIIAGVFNKMTFSKADAKIVEIDGEKRQLVLGGVQAGSPYVYVSLTEVHGKVGCVLRYVNLKHDKVLMQIGLTIEADNPLQTVEIVLPMPNLPTEAGVHALELLCDDAPVGSLRIIVEEVLEENNDHDSTK